MGNKLYVGNLPYSVRDGDLEQAFGQFGAVTSAKVMMERDTGRSKGFGFVEMGSDAEAQAAINGMNGQPSAAAALWSTKPVLWSHAHPAVVVLAAVAAATAVVAAVVVATAAAVKAAAVAMVVAARAVAVVTAVAVTVAAATAAVAAAKVASAAPTVRARATAEEAVAMAVVAATVAAATAATESHPFFQSKGPSGALFHGDGTSR